MLRDPGKIREVSMRTVILEIPDTLYSAVEKSASHEGCAIEDFICHAIAEKILRERGKRGKNVDIHVILSKVPDVEPEERDAR